MALDSHGVGSTALSVLYWLYGIRQASPGDRTGRYDAYHGPDPAVSQPAMLVTLALAPTERRPVEFPEAGRRMPTETYKNLILYGQEEPP